MTKEQIPIGNLEIITAFNNIGLPLEQRIAEALSYQPNSSRIRLLGCGFTIASHSLAPYINRSKNTLYSDYFDTEGATPEEIRWLNFYNDLLLFDIDNSPILIELYDEFKTAGDIKSWRQLLLLPQIPENTPGLFNFIHAVKQLKLLPDSVKNEESQIFCSLIASALFPAGNPKIPNLRSIKPDKDPHMGSCTTVELYFLQWLNDYKYHKKINRGMDIIVDQKGVPVILRLRRVGQPEQGISDSPFALTLKPVAINNVTLPPGSLLAVLYADQPEYRMTTDKNGQIVPISHCSSWFYRLTPFCVPPTIRNRAFSTHYLQQIEQHYPQPETDLDSFSKKALTLT